MSNPLDSWAGDDFEHNVAAALIAVYETKLKKNRGAPFPLKEKHLGMFRAAGPYIPGNGRVCVYGNEVDLTNDSLPEKGCFGYRGDLFEGSASVPQYSGYFFSVCFFKAGFLPKGASVRRNGKLYEYRLIYATDNGIEGERQFFTVSKDGTVTACDFTAYKMGENRFGANTSASLSSCEPHILDETELWASVAIQFVADRRFCWAIQAEEKGAKATLGCEKEEIKSLLYARDLPMTATGRKRPILHLVESHKRRMKNGTDIDITPFLRGTQKVEIDGTVFSVIPPLIRRPELSENSQRYYAKQ